MTKKEQTTRIAELDIDKVRKWLRQQLNLENEWNANIWTKDEYVSQDKITMEIGAGYGGYYISLHLPQEMTPREVVKNQRLKYSIEYWQKTRSEHFKDKWEFNWR